MWRTVKKNKKTNHPVTVQTPYGKIEIRRQVDYCESCQTTSGRTDNVLEIKNRGHYATKDFIELITYMGQMSSSFEDAKEILNKLRGVEISPSHIQKITEEIGKEVFDKETETSRKIFNEPEKYIPTLLEKEKTDGILYILTDGSAVNTRVEDEDGSTWKEMKLGMVFSDKDVIRRGTKAESSIIMKKEYVTYFGSVNEFKEHLFAAAIRAGYGSIKKVVVIGDGAHWIWNMCRELFPDAECILDYYHMAENVYKYANVLFPNDDKARIKWAKTVTYYVKTEQLDKAIRKINKSPLSYPENALNLVQYLENNRDRLHYLQYENNGYYTYFHFNCPQSADKN